MTKISCIIAAYNEAERIGNVLETVCAHPLLDEIIVVDDGSSDNTKEIVKNFARVKLVVHEKNKGKSQAVVSGFLQSSGEYILLMDADLVGLTAKNISDMIEPVISGQADISISLRNNSLWIYKKVGLDFFSGERFFHRRLIQDNIRQIEELPGYGLETYMDKLIIKNKCRIKIVFWHNTSHMLKVEKTGFLTAIKDEIFMVLKILKTQSFFRLAYLMIKMPSLKVK